MSVATPPAQPFEKVHIGPKKEVNTADVNAPMRNLPAIPRSMTTAEAQARRQIWKAPNVFMGEFVFYREYNKGNEHPAWVIGTVNKTYKLVVAMPNQGVKEFSSVSYYDHTIEDPMATGDPMAPYSNPGTFRRTKFGQMVGDLFALPGELGEFKQETARLMLDLTMKMSAMSKQIEAMAQLQPQTDAAKKEKTEAPKPTGKGN